LFSDENGRLTVLDLVTGTRHKVNVATKYSGAPSFAPGDAWIAYEGGPSGEDGGTPTAIYLTKSP
jgi:Tol biopolymer transport system component